MGSSSEQVEPRPAAKPGGILERLRNGAVLGDGGYVLELERRGYIQAGPYTPEVAIEHPEALRQLHREFLRAGSEVLQTLTFYGTADKLESAGHAERVVEINRAAVAIAREVAGGSALVAGSVTMTLLFRSGDQNANHRVRTLIEQQVALQQEAGVDFLIGETFIHLEEALIALQAIRQSKLPAMITMNIGPRGSRDGHSPEACARKLAGEGAAIVGVNCSHDPAILLEVARRMKSVVDVPVACQPVAYATPNPETPFTELREFPLALDSRQLCRYTMAEFARRARDSGIDYIGGCCGVVAHHIRAMAEALGRKPPGSAKSPDLSKHGLASVRQKASERYWLHQDQVA
jgi:betaine-homocysteine S-methyltransferase